MPVVARPQAASLLAAIDARRNDAVTLLRELVSINSVNPTFPGVDREAVIGGESAAAGVLNEAYLEAGCETHFVAEDPERKNLVSIRRGSGGGRSLLLNGHVDTVPPVEPEDWVNGDPWSPEIRDGLLYGLGSTDMKGGLVATWLVLRALEDAGIELSGDVIVQSVVGEETWEHELGTTACVRAGYTADAAIIVEPTSLPRPLTVCNVSAGLWALKVTVRGKSTHAGNRPLAIRPGGPGDEIGVNALEKGVKVIEALQALEVEWGMTKNHPEFPPGFFNLLPGVFYSDAGYPVPYYFPDRAEIQYDVWHDPRDSGEKCAAEIEAFVGAMSQMDTWLREHPPEFEWLRYYPPLLTPWDHPLMQTMLHAHEEAAGMPIIPPTPQTPSNFSAAMDGSWLQQAGTPCVVFGPGDVRIAHCKNEYVDLEEVITAARSLAVAVLDWCGTPS